MESKKTEKKKSFESETFKSFKKTFEAEKSVEEKIRLALDFMKKALGELGGVNLKDFWDAKKLCGPLFKEQINPIKRNHFWSEYAGLGDEARRLKDIKDEEAAFSIQQIEIAIEALSGDIENYQKLTEQISSIDFPKGIDKLSINIEEYSGRERELSLLKILISRLDGLRKEILSTDMRISHKNKILKSLSKLGDKVFPRRKELIKTVSDTFLKDVSAFVKDRFPKGDGKLGAPFYVIRDEIKSFQSFAKALSLNTQAFTKSRKALSECWGKIKGVEKEKRAEMGERAEEQKKNFEALLPKVEAFEQFCTAPENQERSKILGASNTLQEEMKGVFLSRDQVKILKDRIQKARSDVLDKAQAKVDEKKASARKEIEDLKKRLTNLIASESKSSLTDLEKGEREIQAAYEKLSLSSMEIHIFERDFADLKSFIFDKKEETLSKDDLQELYEERANHVEVIKNQVEEYRKEMGGSSLDLEKQMSYRELYDSAKIHLDKEVEALENLEEKLV